MRTGMGSTEEIERSRREKIRLSKLGSKNPSKRLDVREKMRAAKLGKPNNSSTKFKKGFVPWNKGIKMTPLWKKQGLTEEEWKKRVSFSKNKRNRMKLAKEKSGEFFTEGEWELLKKQYNFTCPSCKKREPEISLTIDHIIPLSKGGSNFIENIQPLCLPCNCRKQTKIIKY